MTKNVRFDALQPGDQLVSVHGARYVLAACTADGVTTVRTIPMETTGDRLAEAIDIEGPADQLVRVYGATYV